MDKIQLWVKWQKMINRTSYVTSDTMQFAENPLLHVSDAQKLWKNVYIEIWYEQILPTGTQHTRNGKITENQLLHMQKLPSRTTTKIICVCCNRQMQKHVCKMYNKADYGFSYFVVSQCLQHISNSVDEEQYICTSCEKGLKQTSDENPVLPYNAKNANTVTEANFLKALNQRLNICAHAAIVCYFIKLCSSFTWKTMIWVMRHITLKCIFFYLFFSMATLCVHCIAANLDD